MPILHIRLYGPQTQINIPSVIRQARFKLKGYRILFSRENHGYFHAAVTTNLFKDGNMLAFVQENAPTTYNYDLPLFVDPEKKLTYMDNCDWDMGIVSNLGGKIDFQVQLYNCIERKRYDQAFFDTKSKETTVYYGVNPEQAYFGQHVPLYVVDTGYTDSQLYDASGNQTATTDTIDPNTGVKTTGSFVYPTAKKYVHTGVELAGVDPQPGGADYDARPINPVEAQAISRSGNQLTGSGYRTGPLTYPYSIDLLFEYST